MSNTNLPLSILDLGNNEQVATGIVPQLDGTFLALTFTKSKTFKTRLGAMKWYARNMTRTFKAARS